jgi:hypothetical protein
MSTSISRGIEESGVSASNNDACPGSAILEVCHGLPAVCSPVARALPSSQPTPEINVLPVSTYASFLSQVAKARKPSPSASAHHISPPSNALNLCPYPHPCSSRTLSARANARRDLASCRKAECCLVPIHWRPIHHTLPGWL